MTEILDLRDNIILFYKKHENLLDFGIKFITIFLIFINIGNLTFGSFFNSRTLVLSIFAGFFSMILSFFGNFILICIVSVIFLSFLSIEASILLVAVYILLFVFYAGIFKNHGILIFSMVIAYYLKVPFLVPIFAGIYLGFVGIIPVALGNFLWWFLGLLPNMISLSPRSEFSILDIMDTFVAVYQYAYESFGNITYLVTNTIIFCSVVLIIGFIKMFIKNYTRETAIVSSGVFMIIALIMAYILDKTDFGIFSAILGTLFSIGAMFVIIFFDKVLDYSKCGNIEFEDNRYYYYVRVVPKILSDKLEENSESHNELYDKNKLNYGENINNTTINERFGLTKDKSFDMFKK